MREIEENFSPAGNGRGEVISCNTSFTLRCGIRLLAVAKLSGLRSQSVISESLSKPALVRK